MLKFLLRPFCRHKSVIPAASYLEDAGDGKKRQRWIWKCNRCGKMIKTKGAGE